MPMTDCYAEGCNGSGAHYIVQPTTKRELYLCGIHAGYHAQGIGFELSHSSHCDGCILRGEHGNPTFEEEFGKAAKARLTGSGPAAILELPAHTIAITTDAGTYTYTKPQGGAMYSTISKAISALQDSLSEAQEALEEVQQKKSELEDAESELENMIDQLGSAISSIEDLDGASVSVDVDGVSVYISL